MKKKNFLSYLLSVCCLIPTILVFCACGKSDKAEISAPTLESVYQNTSGAVYASYSNLTTPSQAPEFSLDNGETWKQATKTGDAEIQLLTYDSTTKTFTVPEYSNFCYSAGEQITVVIRESETKDYQSSPKSESKTITVKEPVENVSFMNDQKVIGDIIHNNPLNPNLLNQQRFVVCYNDTLTQYAFGVVSYTSNSDTQYTEHITPLNSTKYEYIIVEPSKFSLDGNSIISYYSNQTYTTCTPTFNILNNYFVSSQYGYKEAKIIVRAKETDTTLKSNECLISVRENIITYTPIQIANITDLTLNYTDNTHFTFNLSNNKTLTSLEISTLFQVQRNATYQNSFTNNNLTNLNFTLKTLSDETKQSIETTDNGTTLKIEVTNNSNQQLLTTINVEIVYI